MPNTSPITFHQTTALITGASAGLGVEFAEQFARRGADLVLVARRRERLQAVADRLSASCGVRVDVIAMDLALPDAGQRLSDELRERGLQVDHLVNNAGFGMKGAFVAAEPERVTQMIRLNIEALVDITRTLLPELLASGRGSLINIASTAAFQPCPSMAAYGASKSFVLNFTEAIGYEVRDSALRVLAVCPGATGTEFFDVVGDGDAAVGSMQTPEQVVSSAFRALEQRRTPPSFVSGRANAFKAAMIGTVPRRLALAMSGRLLKA